MSPADNSGAVTDDAPGCRFILEVGGEVAELAYQRRGSHVALVHRFVPEQLRRRGVAGQLVRAAIERAAAEGLTVEPSCPYVRWWLEDNPEAAAAVAIDWGN